MHLSIVIFPGLPDVGMFSREHSKSGQICVRTIKVTIRQKNILLATIGFGQNCHGILLTLKHSGVHYCIVLEKTKTQTHKEITFRDCTKLC